MGASVSLDSPSAKSATDDHALVRATLDHALRQARALLECAVIDHESRALADAVHRRIDIALAALGMPPEPPVTSRAPATAYGMSDALVAADEQAASLASVASLAVQTLGGCCVIYAGGSDTHEHLTVGHTDPDEAARMRSWLERSLPAAPARSNHPWGLREDASEMASGMTGSPAAFVVRTVELLHALKLRGVTSQLCVPLRGRGKLIGVLVVGAGPERRYQPAEVTRARDLGRCAAHIVDSARLQQEAQNTVSLRDEVTAVVPHDPRDPRAAIQPNAAALLLAERSESTHTRVRGYASSIARPAGRIERLAKDRLDPGILGLGCLTVERRSHPAAALVHEALELHRPLALQSSHRLESQIEQDVGLVACDREKIQQVFSELIGNALKFSPPGSLITVQATPCREGVRFAVCDTGPGIAEVYRERILEPYFRGEARGHAGAGLGLSIAKGLVEVHGGKIWVRSDQGCGTTFYFLLPSTGNARC